MPTLESTWAKPDFFLVGAPKCGTTSLSEYLRRHPDVRLSEPANPLESPIEIYARPRGKKALGIRHLSGGERALTAIGMLFGLYLVKPSPFCIFDEVDAPLDDANIQRFVRMLREFQDDTQFIIITHNRRTIEAANTIYGVSMGDDSVSRVISLKLDEVEERQMERR